MGITFLLSFGNNPPKGRTGAPGEQTCATSNCHFPSNEDINGEINLLGIPDELEPDSTYSFTLELSATAGSPVRTGFQITILDSDNNRAGDMSNAGPSSGISINNNRQYVDHRSPAIPFNDNNSVLYRFDWTSPSDLSKIITMYIAANFANGNASTSGDRIITQSLEMFANEAVDFDEDGFSAAIDCDDTDPNINPGVEEIPNNDVDENCDGEILQIDMDMDGFNSSFDCDDNDPNINPTAQEIIDNDIDENCDGIIARSDLDNDGFDAGVDCDDNNPSINPGATEIPNNDVDEDCDGIAQIIDVDMDGFNSDEDCDDNDPSINPGAVDIQGNNIDEDCDGFDLFIDEDLDGFHSDIDCDDSNPNINPSETEIPNNDVDENCDGVLGMTVQTESISGIITTLQGGGIGDVDILLNGERIATSLIDGTWSAEIELGASNLLSFSRNDNALNGVSALDIVQLKNHILGISPLQSMIRIMSGDVNDDDRISALDVVQLQNVILGIFDEFPNRESWGFDPSTLFIDSTNVTNSIDVTGFKVGDVSGNADPGN